MNKDEIIKGLLKNPESEALRQEYLLLNTKDKEYVNYYITLEEMGTGLPAEKYYGLWEFIKDNDHAS